MATTGIPVLISVQTRAPKFTPPLTEWLSMPPTIPSGLMARASLSTMATGPAPATPTARKYMWNRGISLIGENSSPSWDVLATPLILPSALSCASTASPWTPPNTSARHRNTNTKRPLWGPFS